MKTDYIKAYCSKQTELMQIIQEELATALMESVSEEKEAKDEII